MQRRKAVTWGTVGKSAQAVVGHGLLFWFTLFLALKIDGRISYSWWIVFVPLWLFHAVVARGRFSLPAPSLPHDRHWAPCHAIVAGPLLIAFELLLCVYLQSISAHTDPAFNLKIVFLPLLAFEVIILVDNFRMCRALMPGDEESMSDEAIWETLPHFWVAISMVFMIAATTFTLLKISGDVGALGWWDLFINFGIAECFAFLVCTKWSNPMIHSQPHHAEASSSSTAIRYHDWNSGLVLPSIEDHDQDRLCGLQDIGGHIMKIPLVAFQVLLCMRLEGTPPSAQYIPILALFLPMFLLQGAGVLFAISRLVQKLVLLLHSGSVSNRYLTISSSAHDCFAFLHHGSRLLGWWSIDEGSKEEQARFFHAEATRKRSCVGFALREKYAWSSFLAGTALFASLALRGVRNALYAVSPSRNACLYMRHQGITETPPLIPSSPSVGHLKQDGKAVLRISIGAFLFPPLFQPPFHLSHFPSTLLTSYKDVLDVLLY